VAVELRTEIHHKIFFFFGIYPYLRILWLNDD
jgi:hypothetical protein